MTLNMRYFEQLDRRLARTERDFGIAIETLAVFGCFWMATTPALPEPAAKAARVNAGRRYDAFVIVLGRRLAKEQTLRQEISEDVSPLPRSPDLATDHE